MNPLELTCMLESDIIIQGSILSFDQRCGAFIVNDREQHKPGYQGVLVIMLPHKVIIFDSFAKSPRHYAIDKHLHKMKMKIIINRMVLQGLLSNV